MAKLITPDGKTQDIAPANGKAFTLAELQKLVGGYIEEHYTTTGEVMMVNEDGKRLNLPVNRVATAKVRLSDDDVLVGNVVVGSKKEMGE